MLTYPKPLAQRVLPELQKLPPEVLGKLKYEWDLWKLPHQEVPKTGFLTVMIGGRGSGKTTAAGQWIRQAVNDGVKYIGIIGQTAQKLREEMADGKVGILSCFPPGQAKLNTSKARIEFHTGAVAVLLTAEKPRKIQGGNYERVWIDEASTLGRLEEIWDQLVFAVRVGNNPQVLITTNAAPYSEYLEYLVTKVATNVIQSSSFDNFAYLGPVAQANVRKLALTEYGRAMIYPSFWKPQGILWKREWFDRPGFIVVAPSSGKTVIAVDPAGSVDGDETGIVVVRRSADGRGYVLEDLSGKHAATAWPKIAVDAYKRHRASVMIIERNRGLDYLAALVRPLLPSINLKEIHTRTSKDDRALPIASHYERGIISHCGIFPELEQQMLTWDPASIKERRLKRLSVSPDRLDALVYAIAELRLDVGIAPRLPDRDIKFPTDVE